MDSIRRAASLILAILILPPIVSLAPFQAGTSEYIIINRGIRDIAVEGSTWYDIDGNIIARIELANDFLTVRENLNTVRIYDYNSSLIYNLDLGKWAVNNTGLNLPFNLEKVKGYYYDWQAQKWKVWQRGVSNETHGTPDFSHPAFKQAFKWMVSMAIGGGRLNITFYMSNHDPYIRVVVNSSIHGVLSAQVKPSKIIRLGLKANTSDYSRHLLNWNQRNSKLHGNPWAPPAWSDTAQGCVGQTFILQPCSGVEIRKITNYSQDLNRFIQGHAYSFFNWAENKTGNWYSYEFYIRNEWNTSQNIILENFVPDHVSMVEVSYYDGEEYVKIGEWNTTCYGRESYFEDPLGFRHRLAVHEPTPIGESAESGLNTSDYFGMVWRVLMELNLSGGYVDDPTVYGGSQLRLKLKFQYVEPGYATYLFSNDDHSKYGLKNMLNPYILLYNYSMSDRPLFISANFTKALFYVTANENQTIVRVGYRLNMTRVRGFTFVLGYNGHIDTWRDEDADDIPDIFESQAFEWSTEDMAFASKASLTYYDISLWTASDMGRDLVGNNVTLNWHGEGPRLFGLGTPHSYGEREHKYAPPTVRDLHGFQHILVEAYSNVEFTTSYEVKKTYSVKFRFDYENSTLNLTLSYQTISGYPYIGFTVTQVKGLARRIYRADEIPEGRRKMPDLKYWATTIRRNGTVDTSNWIVDLDHDILIREDSMSSVEYIITVNINPEVTVSIDYGKVIGENRLEIALDYGYHWDRYFNLTSAIRRAHEVGFKMARIHLRTLYKGIRYPPTPSLGWNPENHSSIGYDWSMLDYWIKGVVQNWSMTPIMSIGGPKNLTIPEGMPYIDLGNGKILPNPEDFAQYFADVAKHIVVDLNVSPVYLEVMNEPYIKNDTVALLYINLYNTVRSRVAEVLEPYNKQLGVDVLLGINYIDRAPHLKKPFFKYVYENVEDMEFASVHDYPGGWGHCFSPWADNPEFTFYPPNNKHGWFTDDVAINRTYELTYLHGMDPRITFEEMRARWVEKFGHDLLLLNTEANFNSAWKNGSDPRSQNLISAVVHAIMLKNFAIDGFSYYTFFQLASMHTPESPMYKYGGFGLAIMNWTPPHSPFAPYLVAYLWGRYMDRGSDIVAYKVSNPDLVDVLPTRRGDSYKIWIINKVDSAVTVKIDTKHMCFYNVQMYILDSQSYQQRYSPQEDRVIFGKRGIRMTSLKHPFKFKLKGYTVAVIELRAARSPGLEKSRRTPPLKPRSQMPPSLIHTQTTAKSTYYMPHPPLGRSAPLYVQRFKDRFRMEIWYSY